MNNDLISKSHFDKRVREAVGMTIAELTADFKDGVRTTLELLKTEQTVDAVAVVRCGQCSHSEVCKMDDGDVRYCHIFEMQTEDDYYCADGESLEEDDLLTSANHDGERREG